MKMKLYEAGEKVGYVVENPYEYEYQGHSEHVVEFLSEKPVFQEMEAAPSSDDPRGEPRYEATGEEWYAYVGRTAKNLGVWGVEIVDG